MVDWPHSACAAHSALLPYHYLFKAYFVTQYTFNQFLSCSLQGSGTVSRDKSKTIILNLMNHNS